MTLRCDNRCEEAVRGVLTERALGDVSKDWPLFRLQEEGPLPGPKSGSCLTLGNELFEETHMLTEQGTLLGRGSWVETSCVRRPSRAAPPRGSQSCVSW